MSSNDLGLNPFLDPIEIFRYLTFHIVSIKKDFDQKILKKIFPLSEGGASKNEYL